MYFEAASPLYPDSPPHASTKSGIVPRLDSTIDQPFSQLMGSSEKRRNQRLQPTFSVFKDEHPHLAHLPG